MARQLPDPLSLPRARRADDPPEPSIVADAQRLVFIYVRFVRRHRALLLIFPLIFAVITATAVLSQRRTYPGQLTVAVSRGTDEGATIVASFRPYLENHRIIDEVLRDFKLNEAPHHLTRTTFLRDLYSVEPVRNTNLVTVRLRLHDPELVARVLNRIGERALELLERTATDLGANAQRALKQERDAAAEKVENAATELQRFKMSNQIELLRKDADSALEFRGTLNALSVRIAEQRSRVTQAQADLQKQERIQRLNRTLDDNQLVVEASRQRQGAGGSLAGMTLTSEYTNPIYEQLEGALATARLELASLVEQRRQLLDAKGVGSDTLPLLSKLYVTERTLGDLERRLAVVNQAYAEISTKYELAKSRSVERTAQLVVVDPALPADAPAPRGLVAKTITAAAAGLVLALLIILFQRPAPVVVERAEAV